MQKTPNQKWNEEIAHYRKKCQQIMTISSSIRYVGLVNPYGRTLTGVIKPGTSILLKSDAARNEFFLVSTLFNMRNKISSSIGNMEYAILKHNKITLIVFQSKEGIYYISISKSMTADSIANLISKIKKIV
ncbi:MAG TPA: hypothetical protein VEJ68_02115 [Candidatus Bathyarchaeia archaeon]|nr:hypothetical protein [Candidatus Bathyarchaeia archaeon]